jgi:hypothetical protein
MMKKLVVLAGCVAAARASAFIAANRSRGARWVADQIKLSALGSACGD